MRIVLQIASACLLVQLAFAAKGPVAEPVCDAVCPDTFPIEDNWHIPYTNDCTKFCHCANDGNWKKDCPAGLHFNAELQVCDWPHAAGCDADAQTTDATVNPSSDATVNPSSDATVNPSTDATVNPSTDATVNPSTDATVNPSTDATVNPSTDATVNPSTDSPVSPSTGNPTPGGCEAVICGPLDCFEISNTNDCQAYCDCDHGLINLKRCADGLHFNNKTGDCDFSANANCTVPIKPPTGCENVNCNGDDCIKTSNSLNCTAYCDCDHGNVSVGHCASGLHWNAASGACDFPENANCELSSTPQPDSSTTVSSKPTEDNNVTEPTTPSPNGTCDNICPKVWPIVENNHLPIPGVCTQFCHCANDGNWLKDCPPGLHFNAEKQVCDWQQDAGCM